MYLSFTSKLDPKNHSCPVVEPIRSKKSQEEKEGGMMKDVYMRDSNPDLNFKALSTRSLEGAGRIINIF